MNKKKKKETKQEASRRKTKDKIITLEAEKRKGWEIGKCLEETEERK